MYTLYKTVEENEFKQHFPNILKVISESAAVYLNCQPKIDIHLLIDNIVKGGIGFVIDYNNEDIESLIMFTVVTSIFTDEINVVVELCINIEIDKIRSLLPSSIEYSKLYIRAITPTDIIYKEI